MIAAVLPIPLSWAVAVVYAAAGVGLAIFLHREGHPGATTVSALLAWPVLLPLAWDDADPSSAGPLDEGIRTCMSRLREALADPAVAQLATDDDLRHLERALRSADRKLGLVDRILATSPEDADDKVRQTAARLQQARSRAATEIEAVLAELEQLRLQAALMVLSGDAASVHERVTTLLHRAQAIEEVASLPA